MHPVFDARLGSIRLDYDSPYGPIHSDWMIAATTAEWHITIPANTAGWLELTQNEAAKYKLEGELLPQNKLAKQITRNGQTGYELEAGSYSFQVSVE